MISSVNNMFNVSHQNATRSTIGSETNSRFVLYPTVVIGKRCQ